MAYLTVAEVQGIMGALVKAQCANWSSRSALLELVDPSIVAELPRQPTPVQQLLSDVRALNEIQWLADGSVPLKAFLRQAVLLTHRHEEGKILQHALAKVTQGLNAISATLPP